MNNKFNVDRFLWIKLTRNLLTHVYVNKHGDTVDCMTGEVYDNNQLEKFKLCELVEHDSFDNYLEWSNKNK